MMMGSIHDMCVSAQNEAEARIRQLEEGNAELVRFAREDHNKLQTRIRELEIHIQDLKNLLSKEIGMSEGLKIHIAKARVILHKAGNADFGGNPAPAIRQALEALEGK